MIRSPANHSGVSSVGAALARSSRNELRHPWMSPKASGAGCGWSIVIEAETVERAAELALWHLNEAARLSGTAELPPEIRNAEALLDWCHDTGRTLLHSRDALRLGPARVRDSNAFRAAMAELVRTGWAEVVEGGAVIDGSHRKNVWRIVPKSEGR